jgi:hypothetical protein
MSSSGDVHLEDIASAFAAKEFASLASPGNKPYNIEKFIFQCFFEVADDSISNNTVFHKTWRCMRALSRSAVKKFINN